MRERDFTFSTKFVIATPGDPYDVVDDILNMFSGVEETGTIPEPYRLTCC